MSVATNRDGTVAVDLEYHWQPMSTCPINRKVQLKGRNGLAGHGNWNGKDRWYVGWTPCPTDPPGGLPDEATPYP
jgi:hypothetical protein